MVSLEPDLEVSVKLIYRSRGWIQPFSTRPQQRVDKLDFLSFYTIQMASVADEPKKLKLYSYWRSSCSCRVRIALKLKGLNYEYIPVNLAKGKQFSPEFLKLNPIGYVPVLVDGDIVISDSFAILMYLDEKYPQHPLLPCDLEKKAINYQAANIISSSIQPLQNLAVLKFIEEKVSPDEKIPWV